MTEEIMPKEDRMGKIMTFIGGCLTGVLGVFAVAVMSELSTSGERNDGDNPSATAHSVEVDMK